MKRFIVVLLSMLLVCVCACAEGNAWQVNMTEHWKLDANGEKTELGAHEVTDGRCTGCGALVDVVNDMTYVLAFDEYGNVQDDLVYTADGECVINFHYERTYLENGQWESDSVYIGGLLDAKIVYGYSNAETGEGMHPAQQFDYAPDGSYRVTYMDTMGSAYALKGFSAEDEELYAYEVKTLYGGNSDYDYTVQMWAGDVLAEEVCYCFDANGAPVVDKYYEMGVLVREDLYTSEQVKEFYVGYISQSITYHADGTQTVVYYDEFGRVVAE